MFTLILRIASFIFALAYEGDELRHPTNPLARETREARLRQERISRSESSMPKENLAYLFFTEVHTPTSFFSRTFWATKSLREVTFNEIFNYAKGGSGKGLFRFSGSRTKQDLLKKCNIDVDHLTLKQAKSQFETYISKRRTR